MPLSHSEQDVFAKACKLAKIKPTDAIHMRVAKQSVDARKKEDLKYSYVVDIQLLPQTKYNKANKNIQEIHPVCYQPQVSGSLAAKAPIAIIGAGPAGIFCAYLLAKNGFSPIVLERGKSVEERQMDVDKFWETGVLDPESNVQFGEGGAGTFSDGKLNTLVKDKFGRNRFVLETFVRFGASPDILYVNKPHIGTDVLMHVVANMRKEIIRLGGSFCFSSKVTDFQMEDGRMTALKINDERWMPVSAAVLAIGHSARDTFFTLYKKQVPMLAKSFAVGMRVEHPQEMINQNQYGEHADFHLLPTAAYKLTHQASNGRGVYSFCMCPGGFVVNASSEERRVAVNGMSYQKRDSKNANSAIIVAVTPQDYPEPDHPLSGIAFQRQLEEAAWNLANGRVPQQLLGDFEHNRPSAGYGAFESCVKGQHAFANLRSIFPEAVSTSFLEGMHAFGRKIKGFDREDCILSGVESRTSSPVRITRNDELESEISGLYPCGEGAGYAGGIMSAAMDGLKVAEAIMKKYMPLER
jgi:hypothetical protein